MPLTPCSPQPATTSISCFDGRSSCCLDSWRLKKQQPPFNGSENRKLHGRRIRQCTTQTHARVLISGVPRRPRISVSKHPFSASDRDVASGNRRIGRSNAKQTAKLIIPLIVRNRRS